MKQCVHVYSIGYEQVYVYLWLQVIAFIGSSRHRSVGKTQLRQKNLLMYLTKQRRGHGAAAT